MADELFLPRPILPIAQRSETIFSAYATIRLDRGEDHATACDQALAIALGPEQLEDAQAVMRGEYDATYAQSHGPNFGRRFFDDLDASLRAFAETLGLPVD